MDEIHAWKDKNLYDVIVDGTSSREQPLIFMITTAGTIRESVYDIIEFESNVDLILYIAKPYLWKVGLR